MTKLLMTKRKRRAVRDLVIACNRMLDRWAEGDAAAKDELWSTLHAAADEADQAFKVHPL